MLAQPAGHNDQKYHEDNPDLTSILNRSLPLDDPVAATCMPEAWVRASMLIRLNSLGSGISGVQYSTFKALMQLIEHDIHQESPYVEASRHQEISAPYHI